MGIIKRLLSKVFKYRGNAERKHGPDIPPPRKPMLGGLGAKLSNLFRYTNNPFGKKKAGTRESPSYNRRHRGKAQVRKNKVVARQWADDQQWYKIVADLKKKAKSRGEVLTQRQLRLYRVNRSTKAIAAT